MKIKIVKNENGSFSLNREDASEIENYSFETTIDFHLLMSELIKNELSEKVELASEINKNELDEQEKKLTILIEEIIRLYNEKCDALMKASDSEESE